MSPGASLRDKPFNSVVGSPDRTAPATVVKEDDLITISFVRASGMSVKQVFQKRDDQLLLTHLSLQSKAGDGLIKLDCTYPAALGATPFPEHLEKMQVRHDAIDFHEKCEIRVVSINQPIPPERFTLEDIKMRPGTPVVGSALQATLAKPFHHVQWNGKALVLVSNTEILLDKTPVRPASARRSQDVASARVLILFGLAVLVMATGVILVNVRKRRK